MKHLARPQRDEAFLKSLLSRRENFLQQLKNGVAILVSQDTSEHPAARRVGYRTSSTFNYLTGLNEPNAVVVFAPLHPNFKTILFVRERDDFTELWNGPMVGVEGAKEILGFDVAHPISELAQRLPEYLKGVQQFYWDADVTFPYANVIRDAIEGSQARRRGATLFTDVKSIVSELRLFKDEWEIQQIQKASDITGRAFEEAMAFTKPGLFEYEVQSRLESVMLSKGSKWRGYESIVASGANACCLHYGVNNCQMENGELLLIDAGAEVNGYTADVTRTFPVGKQFSETQKLIYEIVLQTQKKIIDSIKPGVPYYTLNQIMLDELAKHLVENKIVKQSAAELKETKAIRKYIPHSVGHWLGLDVHDVGRTSILDAYISDEFIPGRPLEPGMVLTVEPGLYFHPNDTSIDEHFRGIGIRIEDDILVVKSGHHNFTGCAKEVSHVEALKNLS